MGRTQTALPADVLVIDDGSSDETSVRARAAGAFVVRHPFNLGVGAAIRTGLRFAHERGYQFVVQIDELEPFLLELAHAPEETPGDELRDLRRRIDDRDLLFKVRVVSHRLENRSFLRS